MAELSGEIRGRIERLLNDRISSAQPALRGYTAAGRWRFGLRSGRTAFAKFGATATSAEALRLEARVYRELRQPFMPTLLAWEDHALQPLMLLEDLGAAYWPPPWDSKMIDQVLETLDAMHACRPELQASIELHGKIGGDWQEVANDPEPFLKLGLATSEWLERALPVLVEAVARVRDEGEELIHLDVRSDNLCRAARGIVLIDWNFACLGNGALDTGFWLPSLQAEGGPSPDVILPDRPDIAAWVSGFFAARAGLPPISDAPQVRTVQLQQLKPALLWAARKLELPPPFSPV